MGFESGDGAVSRLLISVEEPRGGTCDRLIS